MGEIEGTQALTLWKSQIIKRSDLSQSDECRKEKLVCDRHSLHKTPGVCLHYFKALKFKNNLEFIDLVVGRAGCAKLGTEVHALVSGRGG